MAEIVETILGTIPGPQYKLITVSATLGSASDTIVLTQAQTGIQSIAAVVGAVLTAGGDANLCALQASASAMTITVVSLGADGSAATNWDSGTINVTVLGTL